MNIQMLKRGALMPVALVVLLLPSVASAEELSAADKYGVRLEVAIGAHSWPGIADIRSVRGGSFDEVGLSLSLAAHMLYKRIGEGWLQAGIDLGLFTNDSNILLRNETLIARGGYLVPSLKYRPAADGNWSFDAGAGYYAVDIAEVQTGYFYVETEVWEQGALGGFVGVTWDRPPSDPERRRGMTASFRVHMADFGEVRDEDDALPARFGPNAGSLSGPVYQLQIGYRWH